MIRAVWGDSDAARPESLYYYISALRRVLTPVRIAIEGRRPGYRILVDLMSVDAVRFDTLVRTARQLFTGDPEEAARRLRDGLDLWRGPAALPTLTAPGVRHYAGELDARRLDAEEDLADLDLANGQPDLVLDRLRTLAAEHVVRRTEPAASAANRARSTARNTGTAANPTSSDGTAPVSRDTAPAGSPTLQSGHDGSAPRVHQHHQRLAARPAHRRRLDELHRDGQLLMAGPWHDDSGALLVFRTQPADMRQIMAADPYYTTPGVTITALRQWHPFLGQDRPSP